MTDYTKIKSKYVKSKIINLKFTQKNIDYISDLRMIETQILEEFSDTMGATLRRYLKHKYPAEWNAIGLELNPEFVTLKNKIEKQEREEWKAKEEYRLQRKKEKIKSLKSWKEAGGKVK